MRSRTSKSRPRIEPLEDRTLMSTCNVTRVSDTGVGKGFRSDLRYCINKVNAEPGPDTIDFTVTGTINLTGALPNLGSDIDIQGPGADLLTIDADQKAGVLFVDAGAYVLVSSMPAAATNSPARRFEEKSADTFLARSWSGRNW